MVIALVNYRYFISGGPERYYFNIKDILEKNGHKVIPFSVKSSRNFPCEYERYFLDIVDDDIYFAQAKKRSLKMIVKSFSRMFYSLEAKKKMRLLIKEQHPDLIYIMQMHNKISPSIVDAAYKLGVPVIHRISDFQYMCPNALFYNDKAGVCEDCLKGKYSTCIKNKCVLDSKVYSGIKVCAKIFHDMIGITSKIDAFVVPSEFTINKLAEYGIPREKMFHIPTFFNLQESEPSVEYQPFALFVGRIEKQKGLMTLVRAFETLPYELRIVGFSNNGYEDELKEYLGSSEDGLYGKNRNIRFMGRKSFEEIVPLLSTCLFSVVPSEWYDNFPNVVLESFAYKKAVVATDFGSLKYMVDNGNDGMLFKYSSVEDLQRCVSYMFDNQDAAISMGNNAYNKLKSEYTAPTHYNSLISLMQKTVNNNGRK